MTKQESDRPTGGASRQLRRSVRRSAVVRLISTNPLALPELDRLAKASHLRCRRHYLKLGLAADGDDIRLPRATVHVIDSSSTGPLTEKVVAAIRTQHPRSRVIVLVDGLGETQGFTLLHLGVKGILHYRDVEKKLSKVIGMVAAGGVRMPPGMMARFLDSAFGVSSPAAVTTRRLSQRERQVLDCVVRSQSNKEIAHELHISESTVKFHLARIFRKFHVRRRAELIVQSVQEPAMLVH
jgi:DNA-binding NarL/FixJ family response regulator